MGVFCLQREIDDNMRTDQTHGAALDGGFDKESRGRGTSPFNSAMNTITNKKEYFLAVELGQ